MSDVSQPADLPLPENAIKAGVQAILSAYADVQPDAAEAERDVAIVLTAAADVLRAQGAAAERERIRQLAERCKATYLVPCDDPAHDGKLHTHHRDPFADLLAGDAP